MLKERKQRIYEEYNLNKKEISRVEELIKSLEERAKRGMEKNGSLREAILSGIYIEYALSTIEESLEEQISYVKAYHGIVEECLTELYEESKARKEELLNELELER